MANPVLGPIGLQGRTETHRKELMTLYVTRQNQEFVTSRYMQLCDVELINASVQLVGEPGLSGSGYAVGAAYINYDTGPAADELLKEKFMFHNTTINLLNPTNGQGVTSNVYGSEQPNRMVERPHLNHSNVNVRITGMRENHQFRQDEKDPANQLDFCIPTDLGLADHRATLASWPPTPLLLERARLEQMLKVETQFVGSGSPAIRQARFVEDWADSPVEIAKLQAVTPILGVPNSTRNPDGTIMYFPSNNEDILLDPIAICQVPGNLIVAMKLIFQITPRTQL